eukprot:Gb_27470 [translate_table: standard]
MRISNSLVGILNFVVFLLSIPILGSGIWLATRHATDCEKFLQGPVIIIGVFIMLVSLAGFIGACFRVSWLLWIYLFVMFLLIILLFCFTIFAFVVTNKGAGKVASGRGYKDYRLGDYSNWLQKRVQNSDNWNKILSCIRDAKVCQSLGDGNVNDAAAVFYQRNLSPIQVQISGSIPEVLFLFVSLVAASHPRRAVIHSGMQRTGMAFLPQIQQTPTAASGVTIRMCCATNAIPAGRVFWQVSGTIGAKWRF